MNALALTPAQETVLEVVARAKGRPRSFDGPQLRVANGLVEKRLLARTSRSNGCTLTDAGVNYAQSRGWLEPPAPPPAQEEASAVETLTFLLEGQRGRTLRTAELLLDEVTRLVAALRAGAIPTSAINPNTVSFLVADHSKLVTLTDTLELVKKG